MKVFINEFKEFCKNHILLIIFDVILTGIVFGIRIMSSNITVDTELFMDIPYMKYNWLEIGRWGLIFLKEVFKTSWFNIYANGALAYLVMIAILVSYAFLFYRLSKEKLNFYVFSGLFITHPILVFQWWFRLQTFEIAVSILLIPLALLFIFDWLDNGNKLKCILGMCLMVLSFGCYQTNVILYVASALLCYVLKYGNIRDFKTIFRICLQLIITFIIAFLINTFIIKLFFATSDYLDASFLWGKADFGYIKYQIKIMIIEILFGSQVMNKVYLFVVITIVFAIIVQIIKKKCNLFNVIVIFAFLITPFLLGLYLGSKPVYRSQYILPFVIAGGAMLAISYYDIKEFKIYPYIKIITQCVCCFFIMLQIQTTMRLWYTEDVRYEQDCELLQNIIVELQAEDIPYSNKPVVFLGKKAAPLNNSCTQQIEFIGKSYFDMAVTGDMASYFYTNANLQRFARLRGYTIAPCSQEYIAEATKVAGDMNFYPQKGYIREFDNFVVVKLSNDF